MAIATTPLSDRSTETRTVADVETVQAVLDAIGNADCRAILDATGEEALSTSELAETCDLPLSTTYRKVDLLTEVGLLAEHTRLCPDGKHASEYVRAVDDVHVAVGDADAGIELTLTRRRGDDDASTA